MGKETGISWADSTWNPIRGCTRVSAGCEHCYAERVAVRFSGPGQPYEGLASRETGRWTGKVRFVEERLGDPLRWKEPKRIFVNSMSDLFHEKLSDATIDRVFAVMALAPQHTFLVLTKRPERMRAYCATLGRHHETDRVSLAAKKIATDRGFAYTLGSVGWHLPNIWLGVSVENQATADERIPLLLQTPAAKRFVSAEPLLGPIEMAGRTGGDDYLGDHYDRDEPGIDWIIVGGESGPGARPCDVAWIRSVVEQCRQAGVACFVKQLGARPFAVEGSTYAIAWSPNGRAGLGVMDDCGGIHLQSRSGSDPSEWPDSLRVQEFPH